MYQHSLYLMTHFKVTLFVCWTPKPLYSSCKPSETNCCTVSSTNKIASKTLIGKLILQCIQDNGNQLVKTWSGQRAQQSEQHMSAKCWTPMQLKTAVIVSAAGCCFSGVPRKLLCFCIVRRILIWCTESTKCESGMGTTCTDQVKYAAAFVLVYVAL